MLAKCESCASPWNVFIPALNLSMCADLADNWRKFIDVPLVASNCPLKKQCNVEAVFTCGVENSAPEYEFCDLRVGDSSDGGKCRQIEYWRLKCRRLECRRLECRRIGCRRLGCRRFKCRRLRCRRLKVRAECDKIERYIYHFICIRTREGQIAIKTGSARKQKR